MVAFQNHSKLKVMVVIFVMKIKKRCYKFKIDNGPIVDLTRKLNTAIIKLF